MSALFPYDFYDYSDKKWDIVFAVPKAADVAAMLKTHGYVDSIQCIDDGLVLSICVQQIPEIVRFLAQKNIAIYGIKAKEA